MHGTHLCTTITLLFCQVVKVDKFRPSQLDQRMGAGATKSALPKRGNNAAAQRPLPPTPGTVFADSPPPKRRNQGFLHI